MLNRIGSLTLVLLTLLLTGCGHARMVQPTADPPFRDVNAEVRGKVARVTMQDDRDYEAFAVLVAADTTTWIDMATNDVVAVPTDEIRQIQVVSTGRGALVGLGLGVLAGAAVGAFRAWRQGDDPVGESFRLTQEEKYALFPAAHAVYGLLVSTPPGAAVGARDTYRFTTPTASSPEAGDREVADREPR